jgi:hypothetical protein
MNNPGGSVTRALRCALLLIVVLPLFSVRANSLDAGKKHFVAGRYVDAIEELRKAASAALSIEARQAYVQTGTLESIAEFEESLVFLALAYDRVGRENEARDAITRLLNAERIQPTYASLKLPGAARGFEELAARLVPSMQLPANASLKNAPATPVVVQPTLAQQRADMMSLIEERVAAARAEIEKSAAEQVAKAQKEADDRVERERAAVQKAANERVASETAAAARAAEQRISAARAEAERTVEERIAAGRAAAHKAAEETIAAERKTAEARTQEVIARERAENEKATAARIAALRAENNQTVERRIAEERVAMQKSAEERIVAARQAAESAAQEQIAAARTRSERDVAERIAAVRAEAEAAAQQKISAERTEIQRASERQIATIREETAKAADAKIAAEREAMQKLADQQVAAARVQAEQEAQQRVSAVESDRRRVLLTALREAETLAIAGQLEQANRVYVALAQGPTSTRDAIAAAAAGLYRTGAFREAVLAFSRLGALRTGEDDLRYYYAVSLFETGRHAEAQEQLALALPNLQRTPDVERYRVKIEQTAKARTSNP